MNPPSWSGFKSLDGGNTKAGNEFQSLPELGMNKCEYWLGLTLRSGRNTGERGRKYCAGGLREEGRHTVSTIIRAIYATV